MATYSRELVFLLKKTYMELGIYLASVLDSRPIPKGRFFAIPNGNVLSQLLTKDDRFHSIASCHPAAASISNEDACMAACLRSSDALRAACVHAPRRRREGARAREAERDGRIASDQTTWCRRRRPAWRRTRARHLVTAPAAAIARSVAHVARPTPVPVVVVAKRHRF